MQLAAISPFLAFAVAALVVMIVTTPLRLFGCWLERAGRRMEERRRTSAQGEKPYDPFAT